MPSLDLFGTRTESEIRDLLDASAVGNEAFREQFRLALDYLENRQSDDISSRLMGRYTRTQEGAIREQGITPVTFPLTERYIAEAASLYNRPVTRTLHDESGTEVEKQTDELRAMLAESSYDEAMHRVDQYTELMHTACLWYQTRGGEFRPVVYSADRAYPVLPQDDWSNPAIQADYAGHVLDLGESVDKAKSHTRRYVFVSHADAAFYEGVNHRSPDSDMFTVYNNRYRWPQVVDGESTTDGVTKTLPLQMLSYWHKRMPTDELIKDTDVPIVTLNQEFNLQASVLLDTLAHQGWAMLVYNALNDGTPAFFSAGPRNGIKLQAGETIDMVSSPVNYTDIVTTIGALIKLMSVSMRQSPNDFSMQAQSQLSGFAKLVDSLPKLEARSEKAVWFGSQERRIAWPRLAAIGQATGKISGTLEQLAKLSLVTKYAPVEFPKAVDERIKEETHDISIGLTTPAKILASKSGITPAEAEAEIAANLGLDDADEVADKAVRPSGVQMEALINIVKAVSTMEIPRDSGIQMIMLAFGVSSDTAIELMAQAGDTFVSSALEPKAQSVEPVREEPAPPPEPDRRESKAGSMLGRAIGRRSRNER